MLRASVTLLHNSLNTEATPKVVSVTTLEKSGIKKLIDRYPFCYPFLTPPPAKISDLNSEHKALPDAIDRVASDTIIPSDTSVGDGPK